MSNSYSVIVLISANIEWQALRSLFPLVEQHASAFGERAHFGEWFDVDITVGGEARPIVFFHSGWGKISAAASTQYVIDCWTPQLLVNLGTCGGFEGRIEKGAIVLVERTIVYDIIEQMGDFNEHIAAYSTEIDLSWLGAVYPQQVVRSLLVSADRDLLIEDLPQLVERYGAVAGDWESGAIAWVANQNHTPCLILRGVSDLVGKRGGEAYAGNIQVFRDNADQILSSLVTHLPGWLAPAFSRF